MSKKSPCCGSLQFDDPTVPVSYKPWNLEPVIEDMKSRCAITTTCQLFALASSTLLVQCSTATYKVSVTSVFLMISGHLIAAAHTSDQEATDKQAWSLLPAGASVLHARSLHAFEQDNPIHIHVFVRSSEWAGNARARWSLASRT